MTKSELPEANLIHRKSGAIVQPFWSQERLRNEAATLNFIAARTTIPVPSYRLYSTDDGLLHLETTRIKDAVELAEIPDGPSRAAALAAVDEELRESVLPQLRALTRDTIGSVDEELPVFPPSRIYMKDYRSWERITADAPTAAGEGPGHRGLVGN